MPRNDNDGWAGRHPWTGGEWVAGVALDSGIRRFFEFALRCREDSFTHTGSGKSALGAAVYYLLTGDRRAREAACRFADFLLNTQRPDGSWHDPAWPEEVLYSIDASAEFNVWLQEIAAILPGADALWGSKTGSQGGS